MRRFAISTSALRSSLALFSAALIWGLAFVAQRVGLDHVGAFTFNGLRFALGALSLAPLTLVFRPKGTTEAGWKQALLPGVLAGGVLFVAANFQQVGLYSTSAGKAAFLTGFYILLVPLVGLFFGRSGHLGVWLGAVSGLAGLYLLSVTDDFRMGWGDALELGGAVFWTIHILVIDRYSPRVDPLKLSVVQFAVCALASLTVGVVVEPWSWSGVQGALLPLLYAGVGSVGVAYTLQVVGQRGVAPGPAALILSLETVFAALGGWWMLQEHLGARELWGCALMLLGMAAAQVNWLKPRARA